MGGGVFTGVSRDMAFIIPVWVRLLPGTYLNYELVYCIYCALCVYTLYVVIRGCDVT